MITFTVHRTLFSAQKPQRDEEPPLLEITTKAQLIAGGGKDGLDSMKLKASFSVKDAMK